MEFQPTDIWTAAGVLLGFQILFFNNRLNRENALGDKGFVTWLPPSDILNLLSMLVLVVGIFILPVFGFDERFMIYAFGLALLLFMGCPFGLAGHYRLYYKKESSDKEKTSDKQQYATRQEKIVIGIIAGLTIIYIIFVMIKIGIFIF